MSQAPGDVPLFEMIQTLRAQLDQAMEAARDESIRFQVESVELDVKVAVTRSSQAEGGVKFWVINAAGKEQVGHEYAHTFRLKLRPAAPGASSASGELLINKSAAELPE